MQTLDRFWEIPYLAIPMLTPSKCARYSCSWMVFMRRWPGKPTVVGVIRYLIVRWLDKGYSWFANVVLHGCLFISPSPACQIPHTLHPSAPQSFIKKIDLYLQASKANLCRLICHVLKNFHPRNYPYETLMPLLSETLLLWWKIF